MAKRPASAVSLFTAVGSGVVLVVVLLALIRYGHPEYLVIWVVALVAVIGFNIWAARGR